ncbi:NmrA family NAD(P)-binding protein [Salidesulfovibrio onnuriiensis]|uniref:NmrA family NAD(P)-binding protein n=1 Tax=Salidesulfovibrio onnuriiensis TaxID=2583823 RepID=UPI0011CB3B80|nr:NmrA family NAD(P)-binding protein [Salidesulfovibrio onnuriiensis]
MQIFVTGAAGTVGSAMVGELKARGFSVVAGVREESRGQGLGADEVRAMDLAAPETIFHAMQGCRGMVLVLPLVEQMKKYGHNAVLAAKEAGIEHIVRSSGMGSSFDAHWRLGREHGAVDLAVEQSGLGHTILRPNVFMQNFTTHLAGAVKRGVLPLPYKEARVSYTDVRDIAACAAAVFENRGEHDGKVYALTGPEPLTGADVASILSDAGVPVEYAPVEEPEYRQALLDAGAPQWNVDMLVSLARIIRRDMAWNVTGAVEYLTGAKPRSLAAFAAEHAHIWK